MQRTSGFAASALALLAILAPGSAQAVDVAGTSAGISWAAAAGPVSGYAVQISRNGGAYLEAVRVATRSSRVSGQIGETLRVRVAAFDAAGRLGAASAPSDPITFTQVAPPPPPPPPPPVGGNPAGDVDGDGLTDTLAFNSQTGEVSALLLKADGTRAWQKIGRPADSGMQPVGYAEVDGDGQGDLMWRNPSTGTNEVWRMSGASYAVVALPNQPAQFRVKAFRDFTGDGRADALFHDATTGSSEIWKLTGAGRTNVFAIDPAPAGASLAAVADVDRDGGPDLVWHDFVTGELEGWLMDGADPVAVFSLPNAPAGGIVMGSGDLDGDAADDLVWSVQRKGHRSVNVWFMDGVGTPDQGVAVRVGKKARVRGVVDVNNDGRDDLVLLKKGQIRAYRVDPTGTQNAGGETVWPSQSISLGKVPAAKRWYFLVLE